MKTKALIFPLLMTLVVFGTALAQSDEPAGSEPLVLTDEQDRYPLGQHLELLEDPSGELTIEDVTSPEFDAQFAPSLAEVPNFGFTDSAYWVRLPLRNESSLSDRWLLELEFANMDFVDLYTPLPDGEGFAVKQTGNLRPPATRDYLYPHIVFDLNLSPQSEQTVYLRFQSGASMTLPLTLRTPADFLAVFARNQALTWLYFGILIGLLGYNLFLLISLREASYAYLVVLLASRIVNDAAYLSLIQTYVAPNLYYLGPYFIGLSSPLFYISALLFADSFLELRTMSPRFHRLALIMVGVGGVVLLLALFTRYHVFIILGTPWAFVAMATTLVAGILAWLRGFRAARYYMIAWLGVVVTGMLVLLTRLGALPSTVITENAYKLAVVWMAACWSLALADRVNLLKADLQKSAHRLSQILEGLPLGVVMYGRDQRPTYSNRRVTEILSSPAQGIRPDLSAGRTLAQAMEYFSFRVAGSDEAYPLETMPVYRALKGESASADDVVADLQDRRVPLEIWASPVSNERGDVESAVVAFQDITQRKNYEAELAEYRSHLESLVEQRTAQLNREVFQRKFLADIQAKLIKWLSAINEIHQSLGGTAGLPQARDQLLVSISQLLGAKSAFIGMWDSQSDQVQVLNCLRPDDSPGLVDKIAIACAAGSSLRGVIGRGKLLILPADHGIQPLAPLDTWLQDEEILSVIFAPISVEQVVEGVLGLGMPRPVDSYTGEEVTLFERIEFDLASLTEYARLYDSARTLAASEERNRLARDLHDSVTQVLFAASLVAEVLPNIWRRDPNQALESLEGLRRLTRGALAEMRTLLLELRPSALVKTSLPELLAQLTEAVTSRSGLAPRLRIEQIPVLPEEVHISLYRIAQEALNNVVKHAQAKHVAVSLSALSPLPNSTATSMLGIMLVIADDGVGFSTGSGPAEHMGLDIMHERAAAIAADLSIDSQPGRGTVVTLSWSSDSGNHHD